MSRPSGRHQTPRNGRAFAREGTRPVKPGDHGGSLPRSPCGACSTRGSICDARPSIISSGTERIASTICPLDAQSVVDSTGQSAPTSRPSRFTQRPATNTLSTAHRRHKPHGAGFGGVWIARGPGGGKLDAHLTSDHNARHRLTHGMAERAQAASAMRKLQFFRASRGTLWPVGRQ